jgi:hypothetical protein
MVKYLIRIAFDCVLKRKKFAAQEKEKIGKILLDITKALMFLHNMDNLL